MTTSQPPLIPRSVLFGNPVKTSPQISPEGVRLAYLAPVNNVLNVWVGSGDGADAIPVTDDRDRGIRFYLWAADGRHILYLQDIGGDENWRLYAVDVATKAVRDLTPFPEVQVQIVDRDKRFPHELLIGMNKDDARYHDVYHLDLPSGHLRQVAKNPGNVASWVTDSRFQVRGALKATPDGGFELLIRENMDAPWRTLLTWSADDSLTSQPVSFSNDGRAIYLEDSRESDTNRLIELRLDTGAVRLIAHDPQYDIGGVLVHPDTDQIQAVAFDRARTEWTVLDDAVRSDFEAIRRLHHGISP